MTEDVNLSGVLEDYTLVPTHSYEEGEDQNCNLRTQVENVEIGPFQIPRFTNEFWTARQRQASPIHEISYRGCYKAQLPQFFINLLSKKGEIVYDPFSGRGTTGIEAGLLGRRVILNDINPLSEILARPRLSIPEESDVKERLDQIPLNSHARADIDLSMFYHPKTEAEIVSLREYLHSRRESNEEDEVDRWIRMVATNRLTGHSPGFFSVYTLPPNQAVTQERQKRINLQRGQIPPYRNVNVLIFRKTLQLLRKVSVVDRTSLREISGSAQFLTCDARETSEIPSCSVDLTITSPPFLDNVHYVNDNWLRCWFNVIDAQDVAANLTLAHTISKWTGVIGDVFHELYRITRFGGWVAFEVGEIRKGSIRLDEYVVPLGINAGFNCRGILVNAQTFTKTANIWGVTNNKKGTNSNRVVLFRKNE